jgi:hypothetical protein
MRHSFALSLAVIVMAGCSSDSTGPEAPPGTPRLDPQLGRAAFEQACARCHASRDGFDLAAFGFSDTTIIRRAVAHVDTTTARNIVAYIRTVQAVLQDEEEHLFQPGGRPLVSDLDFALALFGRDAWPAELTSAGLLAIDPRTVPVAVRLPIWSDEASNLDWMPDQPLPKAILDYSGGMVAAAITGYQTTPTAANLIRAVNALRAADRSAANPGAPCLLEDPTRVNYRQCFEVRRWTSTLVALHLLRNGSDASLGANLHDVWWDVGNAARKSRSSDSAVAVPHAIENWANWMFLGWSFDPSKHPSVYTGGGFRQMGLTRHATFVALRSQVARVRGSKSPYDDALNAERFAPAAWTTGVITFGLRHLRERLGAGDRPSATDLPDAVATITTLLTEANRKAPLADRAGIQALGQEVLAALGR